MKTKRSKTKRKPPPDIEARRHLGALLDDLQTKLFIAHHVGALIENPNPSEGQSFTIGELRTARLAFDAAFRLAYPD